jgi:hypothetical protein
MIKIKQCEDEMNFEIKNRFSGEVQSTAEINAAENAPPSIKMGLAVSWAFENKADLRDADLRGADLRGADIRGADIRGADLRDANLSDAYLSDADLSGAYLRGADLRTFKADLWMTLTENKMEVTGLIAAMREGRIDGSVYSGECACLKGTLANVKGISVDDMNKTYLSPQNNGS